MKKGRFSERMTATFKEEKERMRRRMLALRSRLNEEDSKLKAEAICRTVWQQLEVMEAHCTPVSVIAAYMAHNNEVDLSTLLRKLWQYQRTVLLPRTMSKSYEMEMRIVQDRPKQLALGRFGLLEPVKATKHWPGKIDGVLVPGVVFSETGHRIGYGAGYYDRFLKQYEKTYSDLPYLVGIAYEFQVVPDLPVEPHDFSMDCIITEERMIEL